MSGMNRMQKLILCQLVTDALSIKEWDRFLTWKDIGPTMRAYAIKQIKICDRRIDDNVNYLALSID